MSSQQSSSETMPVQNPVTPEPRPLNTQIQIIRSPEFQAALELYSKDRDLRKLIEAHGREIARNSLKGLPTEELFLEKIPLSFFSMNNGRVIYRDFSTQKPLPAIRKDKIPKTIKEAREKFRNGEINIMEYRTSISDFGGGHPTEEGNQSLEAMIRYWNPVSEPHPHAKDNNKSRKGFLYNCNTHLKGMIYQGVVKKTIIAMLNMAHSDWLEKYDKDAFVYDDPTLIELDLFLKGYVDNHTPDNASYKKYDMKLFGKAIDLVLGHAKEDIKFMVLLKDMINTFCGKIIYPLTYEEQNHLDIWCHK